MFNIATLGSLCNCDIVCQSVLSNPKVKAFTPAREKNQE